MCGYAAEGAPATAEDLVHQFATASERGLLGDRMIKIYTSGSFFDDLELPPAARDEILKGVATSGAHRLVVESRPEHVDEEVVQECQSVLDGVEMEVGMGLETSSDLIREHAVRKGFAFRDFATASNAIHRAGGRVKAYLLLKPPFLSEGLAVRDAISSAKKAAEYAEVLSLNLCNVQRGTPLERMWERGEYRPPWLWSAVEVLKASPRPIICDPVGAGARRGPHNCGECDSSHASAIRKFSLEQDQSIFDDLHCDCRMAWEKVLDLEEQSFGTPLI